MDFFSAGFISSLLTIIAIDLVLAGDNAMVIALAARSLPAELRKQAILWGTAGAIVIRAAMTIMVVWVLMVPGLRFIGGAVLVWIAYKLLVPQPAHDQVQAHRAVTFWAAMKTIIIADALMGLDNVLAVAGAAQGSFVLVIFGLLVSVPLVVWGSTWMLNWLDRFPALIYLGAGVLAWTAAQMMLHEPMLLPHLQNRPIVKAATYVTIVSAVLLAGLLTARRHAGARGTHGRL